MLRSTIILYSKHPLKRNRGYYMASRRYKIVFECWNFFFSTREEKFRISKRPCNILYLWRKIFFFWSVQIWKRFKDKTAHLTLTWVECFSFPVGSPGRKSTGRRRNAYVENEKHTTLSEISFFKFNFLVFVGFRNNSFFPNLNFIRISGYFFP